LSGRSKERERCPCPGQDPDLNAFGHVGEEISKHLRFAFAYEREVG
jgi:hypothetical protein